MSVNLIANSSFELDTNGDGRADGWGKFGNPICTIDPTKFVSGTVSQKIFGHTGTAEDMRFAPIFITELLPYTLSCYMWVTGLAASAQAVLKVEWRDNDGVLTDYVFQFVNAVDGGWVRRDITGTPPAGSVTAHVQMIIEGGGTCNWDDIQLEQNTVTTAYVSGPADVPPIISMIANTGFAWDSDFDGLADGWTFTGTGTHTQDFGVYNYPPCSQKLVVTGGNLGIMRFAPVKIIVGQDYTLSVFQYITSVTGEVSIGIEWLDSGGTPITADGDTFTSADAGFIRRSVTGTAPVSSTHGRIYMYIDNGGTAYWGNIQFEQLSVMSPGFREPDIDWIVRAVYTASDVPGSEYAISWYVDKLHIRPYEASFAAIAFAAAYRAFNVQKFADIAWNWCGWYRDHMEPDGTMYDYDVDPLPPGGPPTSLVKLATRDSTDSYAAMYLQALRAINIVDPRPLELAAHAAYLDKALDAIWLTFQSDGMTWALPTFHVKYMQDQTETCGGLFSCAELALLLDMPAVNQRAAKMGNRNFNGMETMWNPATPIAPGYNWAKHGDGFEDDCTWTNYLDTLQQIWTVLFGAADATRSSDLINEFLIQQPDWVDQSITGRYDAIIATAMQRTGHYTEADIGLYLMEMRSQINNREFDWNPAHAGWEVIAQLGDQDMYYHVYDKRWIIGTTHKVWNGSSWAAVALKIKKLDSTWAVI